MKPLFEGSLKGIDIESLNYKLIGCCLMVINVVACQSLEGVYISDPNHVATSYQFLPKRKVLVSTYYDYGYETVDYAEYKIKHDSIFLNYIEVPNQYKIEETNYQIKKFEKSLDDSVYLKCNFMYTDSSEIESFQLSVLNLKKSGVISSFDSYHNSATIPIFRISKNDFPIIIHSNVDFQKPFEFVLQEPGNYDVLVKFAVFDIRYNYNSGVQESFFYYRKDRQSFFRTRNGQYYEKN